MARRHRDAIAIQAGACNIRGIARSLVAAADAAAEANQKDWQSNPTQEEDPAVRLIVHQLAFLCKVDEINHELETYDELIEECRSHESA